MSDNVKNVEASDDNGLQSWTAGPVISCQETKGFSRDGLEMKTVDMKAYQLEVYPPPKLAEMMQQPSPDVVSHLEHEGVDTHHLNKRYVSFLAQVRLPCGNEASAAEITLISEQRQNGGIYKHEITVPRNMLCVRESPVETVVDSLNNAFHEHNWYPPY
ncbi:MAG: hypothetical protein ACU836_06520 [Gammaproteobacteria bacterium]